MQVLTCSISSNAAGRFIVGDHMENITGKNIKDLRICKVSLKPNIDQESHWYSFSLQIF